MYEEPLDALQDVMAAIALASISRDCQDLWTNEFQATLDPAILGWLFDESGAISTGRSLLRSLRNLARGRVRPSSREKSVPQQSFQFRCPP